MSPIENPYRATVRISGDYVIIEKIWANGSCDVITLHHDAAMVLLAQMNKMFSLDALARI